MALHVEELAYLVAEGVAFADGLEGELRGEVEEFVVTRGAGQAGELGGGLVVGGLALGIVFVAQDDTSWGS